MLFGLQEDALLGLAPQEHLCLLCLVGVSVVYILKDSQQSKGKSTLGTLIIKSTLGTLIIHHSTNIEERNIKRKRERRRERKGEGEGEETSIEEDLLNSIMFATDGVTEGISAEAVLGEHVSLMADEVVYYIHMPFCRRQVQCCQPPPQCQRT